MNVKFDNKYLIGHLCSLILIGTISSETVRIIMLRFSSYFELSKNYSHNSYCKFTNNKQEDKKPERGGLNGVLSYLVTTSAPV